MKNDNKVFLKIILGALLMTAIVYCCVLAVTLIVESGTQDRLTECEAVCYPDDVDEEIDSCICLPPVEAR